MRRRILIAIVGVATVAVLVFAIPLGITVRDLTIQDQLNELERAAEHVGRAVEPEHVNTGRTGALTKIDDEFHAAVYDRAGHKVRGTGPARLELDLRGALHATVARRAGDKLRVAIPIGNNPAVGAVRTEAAASGADDRVVDAWLLLGGFALLAVGAAAALATWLSLRLDAPLARLASAAHRIGDGDFTSRAPRSGVSEIDGVAEAIDTTAQRLGDVLERERAFSADVSHQLRTAVAGLRVTLESALLTGSSKEAAIEQGLEQTDRLAAIIADLVALRRDAPGDRAPLDARALLDSIQTSWHGRLSAEGRPLRVSVDADLPPVRASSAATRQILEVLVDNAVRHGEGEVRVAARAAPEGIAIDVTDEGPGVGGDNESIFARRTQSPDGHGIGLSLARGLAEAEGGRLLVTRRAPGARFTLLLPVTPSA